MTPTLIGAAASTVLVATVVIGCVGWLKLAYWLAGGNLNSRRFKFYCRIRRWQWAGRERRAKREGLSWRR